MDREFPHRRSVGSIGEGNGAGPPASRCRTASHREAASMRAWIRCAAPGPRPAKPPASNSATNSATDFMTISLPKVRCVEALLWPLRMRYAVARRTFCPPPRRLGRRGSHQRGGLWRRCVKRGLPRSSQIADLPSLAPDVDPRCPSPNGRGTRSNARFAFRGPI